MEPRPQRRTCGNACMIASYRSRNPDRVARYRAAEVRPTKQRYCGCGVQVCSPKRTCEECKRANARRLSRLASERKHSKQPRPCGECANLFTPQYGDKRRTYCSSECQHKATHRAVRLKGKARKRAATVEPVNPTRVFDRDGWRCHLCNGMTDRTKRGTLHPNAPELDHIVPLSKGGAHSYANTACAHKKCNHAKSDRIIGQPSLLAA